MARTSNASDCRWMVGGTLRTSMMVTHLCQVTGACGIPHSPWHEIYPTLKAGMAVTDVMCQGDDRVTENGTWGEPGTRSLCGGHGTCKADSIWYHCAAFIACDSGVVTSYRGVRSICRVWHALVMPPWPLTIHRYDYGCDKPWGHCLFAFKDAGQTTTPTSINARTDTLPHRSPCRAKALLGAVMMDNAWPTATPATKADCYRRDYIRRQHHKPSGMMVFGTFLHDYGDSVMTFLSDPDSGTGFLPCHCSVKSACHPGRKWHSCLMGNVSSSATDLGWVGHGPPCLCQRTWASFRVGAPWPHGAWRRLAMPSGVLVGCHEELPYAWGWLLGDKQGRGNPHRALGLSMPDWMPDWTWCPAGYFAQLEWRYHGVQLLGFGGRAVNAPTLHGVNYDRTIPCQRWSLGIGPSNCQQCSHCGQCAKVAGVCDKRW